MHQRKKTFKRGVLTIKSLIINLNDNFSIIEQTNCFSLMYKDDDKNEKKMIVKCSNLTSAVVYYINNYILVDSNSSNLTEQQQKVDCLFKTIDNQLLTQLRKKYSQKSILS
ncbi:hypothetical protein HCX58_13895 [Listeria welshimeri]|nr:hypothetical protein [Listeria welshimeri]